MGAIVHSVLEADAAGTARRLAEIPAGCDWVEIRADRLGPDDLPGLIARAPRRCIVTIRRPTDGGGYEGSEEARVARLRSALRAGAVVDVEYGSEAASLATTEDPDRVILSHHGGSCRGEDLERVYRALAGSRAGRLKIVPRAERLADGAAVRDLLVVAARDDRALACFALGATGAPTRIFALSWGSWATYGSAAAGRETGEGQLVSRDLVEVYRAGALGPATRRFALAGRPVGSSPSPAMHAAAYRAAGIDGVYLPLDGARVEDLDPLLGEAGLYGIEAFGVTIPLKEAVFGRCASVDAQAARAGAVNTVRVEAGGWHGFNTDAEALRRIVRGTAPAPLRVAVLGAGGAARAAAALVADGDAVVLYARDPNRAAEAARAIGAGFAPIDDLPEARWDVLVQATPLGRAGEEILSDTHLRGRLVVDLAYGPAETPLVEAARRRGLETVDGLRFLAAQAALQFERMTGSPADPRAMEAVARGRLRTPRSSSA